MGTLIVTYPAEGEGQLEGKFVQLRLETRDCLLFAAATHYHYHSQIFARFLTDEGIAIRIEGDSWRVADDAGVTVTGGGRFLLDPDSRSLRVWGNSSVYGPFDAALLADQLRSAGSPWDSLELTVL
ncbi:MAG: hypothetical protein WAM94_04385 [Chromatiaceae bacterium]